MLRVEKPWKGHTLEVREMMVLVVPHRCVLRLSSSSLPALVTKRRDLLKERPVRGILRGPRVRW